MARRVGRFPGLWNPQTPPAGPVELDPAQNPGFNLYWLFNTGGIVRNIARPGWGDLRPSAAFTPAATALGAAISGDGSASYLDTQLLPSQVGVGGQNSRSVFAELYWRDQGNTQNILAYGRTGSNEQLFEVTKAGYQNIGVSLWGDDFTASGITAGFGDFYVRLVVTLDGPGQIIAIYSAQRRINEDAWVINTPTTGATGVVNTTDDHTIQVLGSDWRNPALNYPAYSLGVAPVCFSATTATRLLTDPYGIVRPTFRRPYIAAAAGGGVTVSLTQTAATGTGGSLTPSRSVSPAQVAASGSVGTIVATRARTLAQVAGTGTVGTIAPSATRALSQAAGAAAVGTVTVSAGSNVTVALSQVAGTTAVGTLSKSASIGVAQVAGIGAVGTVARDASVTLGQAAAASTVGTTSPGASNPLSQVAAVGTVGTIQANATGNVTAALAQAAATSAVGAIVASLSGVPITVSLLQAAAIGAVGTLRVQSSGAAFDDGLTFSGTIAVGGTAIEDGLTFSGTVTGSSAAFDDGLTFSGALP